MADYKQFDITKVFKDYLQEDISRAYGNFECPFHDDTSKNSMKYYKDTNTVRCFGACGKTFNPVTLLAQHLQVDTKEAYKILCQKYYPEALTPEQEEEIYRQRHMEELVQFAEGNLKEEHIEVLKNRGLTEETIRKKRIGAINHEEFLQLLEEEDAWSEVGILSKASNDKIASNFIDKIIIPIVDDVGKVVSVVAWNYKGIEGEPKYAEPRGQKKCTFGKVQNDTYLVEGVFDYLVLEQMGEKVCCFLGTQQTEVQLKQLRQLDSFKVLFDSDDAGKKAASVLATTLFPKATVITLPLGEDPNSYFLKNGAHALREYIQKNEKDILDERLLVFQDERDARIAAKYLSTEIMPLLQRLELAEQEVIVSRLAKLGKEKGISKGTINRQIKGENSKGKGLTKGDEPNLVTKLHQTIRSDSELYINTDKRTYIKIKSSNEIYPIMGEEFKSYLQVIARKNTGNIVAIDAINALRTNLDADAKFEGTEIQLENRVHKIENAFYYDLSKGDYKVVKITAGGWTIEEQSKPMFRREQHQKPQVIPLKNGDIKNVLSLFPSLTDDQQLLYQVFLVYSLIPEVPKVIMYVQGEKGAGKSDFTKVTRQLIDPSTIESLKQPNNEDKAVQNLQHHYVTTFDNLNSMQDWFIRLCCTAVTGEADERRKLFTDEDTVIFRFRRVIILNAINRLGIHYPDFQERLQVYQLPRISEENRLEREVFWEKFEKVKASIVGGMFDTLSKAMAIKPSVHLAKKPRMADYAAWGSAIAIALGYTQEEFLDALYRNIQEVNEDTIENYPIAYVVKEFMESKSYWKGRASELLECLREVAFDLQIDMKDRMWPKGPQAVTRRLNEIKSNLKDVGIEYFTGKENNTNSSRFIELVNHKFITVAESLQKAGTL